MPEVPFYVQVGGAVGAAIPAFIFMSVVSWKVIAQVWGRPMITAKVPALDGQIDALRDELQTAIADSRRECSDDFKHLTKRLEDGRDQIQGDIRGMKGEMQGLREEIMNLYRDPPARRTTRERE